MYLARLHFLNISFQNNIIVREGYLLTFVKNILENRTLERKLIQSEINIDQKCKTNTKTHDLISFSNLKVLSMV